MKNKKSLAMAMAAVSTFGTVAPAFANQVAATTTIVEDVRLASGKELKADGKVYTRTEVYNTNGTQDRSDDTLKTEFKNVEVLVSKEDEKDSYLDQLVLFVKATDISAVNNKEAEIKTAKAMISKAKEEGATVVVKNEAAKIVNGKFEDSKVTVEITNKDSKTPDKIYVFRGADGIVDDEVVEEEKPVTGASLFDEIFSGSFLANNVTIDLDTEDYFNVNLMKALIEANIEKFDVFKEESGIKNADLDVVLYVKGSDQTKEENKVITIKFKNFDKVNKDLLAVTLPNIEKSDFANHWAKEQIVEAMSNKVINSSSTFRPEDSITRAEFVKIVNRAFGIDSTIVDKSMNTEFADVKAENWYYADVKAAARAGYINGYEDGTFRPDQPITRQEAAKIIAKLYDICNDSKEDTEKTQVDINGVLVHLDTKTTFSDDSDIAVWADESVQLLTDKGVIKGYAGNVFKPNNNITRAEAIVMLSRA